jgi:hypothetical protein
MSSMLMSDVFSTLGLSSTDSFVVVGPDGVVYMPGSPFNTLKKALPGKAYWIYTPSDKTITVPGSALLPTDQLPLSSGWTQIAYWGTDGVAPATGFACINNLYDILVDESGKVYMSGSPFNTLKTLQKNKGYFVHTTAPANLTYQNSAPVANAGTAQNVVVASLVTLDGSASSDANGDALTYIWAFTSKPAGSTATLSSTTTVKPTFTADVVGTYVFHLTVNDGKLSSNSSTLNVVSIANNGLQDFLYAHSTAKVSYWAQWGDIPLEFKYLQERMSSLPTQESGVTTGLFSISYTNSNLPQFSLHIRRPGNAKLLVYNHGHSGLPLAIETFASDFLSKALSSGFDLLVTSMPLTGLNVTPPTELMFIKTRGQNNPAFIDPQLMTGGWQLHAMYELIDDPDHYMHFFIDGAVIPSILAMQSSGSSKPTVLPSVILPYTGKQYNEISYVGMSGGANTGLVACAVHTFAHCILVAGVMPDYLRASYLNNFGDAEQLTSSFYENYTVQNLLAIANDRTRKLTLVYNRQDSCCFADPAASQFKADFPQYDIRLTELGFHGYVAKDILGVCRT